VWFAVSPSIGGLLKLNKTMVGYFAGRHVMVYPAERRNLALFVRHQFWRVSIKKLVAGLVRINIGLALNINSMHQETKSRIKEA